jgi:thioredoxin-like negative regulator of GroEL
MESVITSLRSAMQRSDWSSAIATAEAFLEHGGSDWRVSLNLAVCACRARRGNETSSLIHVEQALQLSNYHTVARLGAAEVYLCLGLWEQVLSLLGNLPDPQPWLSFQMRAEALGRLGEADKGLQLLESWPQDRRMWQWRMAVADVHVQAGDFSSAEAGYRSVLAERPHQAEAHINLSLALLSQQRCAEAWPHYEWRLTNPRLDNSGIPKPLPSLQELTNQHVVLLGEQGIGDQIMASRYISVLADACQSLRVIPAPRLEKLLRRNSPKEVSIGAQTEQPNDVIMIGMASLPMLFWDAVGLGLPERTGYLKADSQKILEWQTRLNMLPPGPKIGIAWLGGTTGAERRERALSKEDLMQLKKWQGVHWIDLQYLNSDHEHLSDQGRQAGLHRLGEPGVDVDDTLALIECLDSVLTTRQTVAHLTGALGKQGQVLVPARPEWRYWGNNNRWAWYPTMQLIHQEHKGDWRSSLLMASCYWKAKS